MSQPLSESRFVPWRSLRRVRPSFPRRLRGMTQRSPPHTRILQKHMSQTKNQSATANHWTYNLRHPCLTTWLQRTRVYNPDLHSRPQQLNTIDSTDTTASTELTDSRGTRSIRDSRIPTESTDHAGISVTTVSFACSRTRDTIVIPRVPTIHVNHSPRVLDASQSTPSTAISKCTLGPSLCHRTRGGSATIPNHSIHRSKEYYRQLRKLSFNHASHIAISPRQRITANRLRLWTLHTLQPSIPQTSRQHHNCHESLKNTSEPPKGRHNPRTVQKQQ